MSSKEIFKRIESSIEPAMLKKIEGLFNLYYDFATEKAKEYAKQLVEEQKQRESQGENVAIMGTPVFRLQEFKIYVAEHNKSLSPLAERLIDVSSQESHTDKKQ